MSQSNKDATQGVVFEGDSSAGYICTVVPNTRSARSCRMWRSLGAQVVKISSVDFGRDMRPVEHVVSEMTAAVTFYLRAMSRQE